MTTKYLLLLWLVLGPLSGGGAAAQDDSLSIHVSVVLVQLNVAVTDRKGNYVSGLRPEDFAIVEDKIPQKTATFEEGNEPTRRLIDIGSAGGKSVAQGDGQTQEPSESKSTEDQTNPFSGANFL